MSNVLWNVRFKCITCADMWLRVPRGMYVTACAYIVWACVHRAAMKNIFLRVIVKGIWEPLWTGIDKFSSRWNMKESRTMESSWKVYVIQPGRFLICFFPLYFKSVWSGSYTWVDGREVNREAEFGKQVRVVGGSEDESGVCWALITHTGECVCVCVHVCTWERLQRETCNTFPCPVPHAMADSLCDGTRQPHTTGWPTGRQDRALTAGAFGVQERQGVKVI